MSNIEKKHAFALADIYEETTNFENTSQKFTSVIEKMLEEAKILALKESENIIRAVRNTANGIITNAKLEIDKEIENANREIQDELSSIVSYAASKAIEIKLNV